MDALPRYSILVVDDVKQNLDLLVETLSHDYEVAVAIDGESALDYLQHERPDLILLDIMMPGINGFEVCRRVKADPATQAIPVIFITARSEDEDEAAGLQVGAIDYLTKPISPPIVRARIKNQLALKQAQQELEAHNALLETRVAERTRELSDRSQELAAANERLQFLDRIKRDFLRMIEHELRTPLHGLLGAANYLIDLVPASDEKHEFTGFYRQSQERLIRLLHDAKLLYELNLDAAAAGGERMPLKDVVTTVAAHNTADLQINLGSQECLADTYVRVDPDLFYRSLYSLVRLANCFIQAEEQLALQCRLEAGEALLEFPLDRLHLSDSHISQFFEIASEARGSSHAQALGLAPVVAERIIASFGGKVELIKTAPTQGTLRIQLPLLG